MEKHGYPQDDVPHQGHAQPPQYGQPPPGYHQQPPAYGGQHGQQQQTVVVTNQPPVVLSQQFREVSVRMTCQFCSSDIMTSTTYESGTMTWMAAGGVCLAGCFIPLLWLGCCLIPFCVDSAKDVVHKCPNCQQMVGRYNRMS